MLLISFYLEHVTFVSICFYNNIFREFLLFPIVQISLFLPTLRYFYSAPILLDIFVFLSINLFYSSSCIAILMLCYGCVTPWSLLHYAEATFLENVSLLKTIRSHCSTIIFKEYALNDLFRRQYSPNCNLKGTYLPSN